MGLKMIIDGSFYNHEKGFMVHATFPVILTGNKTIEFPEHDIEEDLSLKELGFDVFTPEMSFYEQYTKKGFEGLLKRKPFELYKALEQQGYDFDNSGYNKESFLKDLFSLIEENKGHIPDIIEIVENIIGDDEDLKEDLKDYLISGLQYEADPEHSDGFHAKQYVNSLLDIIPRDRFKFIEPTDDMIDTREDEWGESEVNVPYTIEIDGEEIVSWCNTFDLKITDPTDLTYWTVTDRVSDYDPGFGTPNSAIEIMSMFGWNDTIDENRLPPPVRESPNPDETGEFAVLYTKVACCQDFRRRRNSDLQMNQSLVRYESLEDAESAAGISKNILQARGEDYTYEISILSMVDEDEIEKYEDESIQHEGDHWITLR